MQGILGTRRRGSAERDTVIGVSRRPGERLSFGELAAALLESSDRSLFFLAPQANVRATAVTA